MWVILIFIRAKHIYCSMFSTLEYDYVKEVRKSGVTESCYDITLHKITPHRNLYFELLNWLHKILNFTFE